MAAAVPCFEKDVQSSLISDTTVTKTYDGSRQINGTEHITDYRSISLIHSVAKLIAKVLALRLAPVIKDIISKSQSAFIRGRSIHDNFQYVRSSTRRFHRNRAPMLLIKLDISKAFDSVRWDYLLSLLQHIGFPAKWRDWITAILSTSSS